MDSIIVAAIVGPIITGVFAYIVATIKSNKKIEELRENLHHEIEKKAMDAVTSVTDDVMKDFRRDIESLQRDKRELEKQLHEANIELKSLSEQVHNYKKLIESMENELSTLRAAVKFYESQMIKINNCPCAIEERP